MSVAHTAGETLAYRHRVSALLSYVIESRALGTMDLPRVEAVSPWDTWWMCCRAAASEQDLRLADVRASTGCRRCIRDVQNLVAVSPPRFPLGSTCDCLRRWAVSMRRPAPDVDWPLLRTQLAMVKPGANTTAITDALTDSYTLVHHTERHLGIADVRRLYPDAYGADFVARQDAYLTSGPIQVLVLVALPWTTAQPREIKARIRRLLGRPDPLRNHVHMPDNPGDALCDLHHLTGAHILRDLYDRHDRDTAPFRLARYRDLLALG
jgi:hypothetical protein